MDVLLLCSEMEKNLKAYEQNRRSTLTVNDCLVEMNAAFGFESKH